MLVAACGMQCKSKMGRDSCLSIDGDVLLWAVVCSLEGVYAIYM
jgi:hypothetical protein